MNYFDDRTAAAAQVGKTFVRTKLYKGRYIRKKATAWRRVNQIRRNGLVYAVYQVRMHTIREDRTLGQGEYWEIGYLLRNSDYVHED